MTKRVCVDLFSGLGGFSQAFLDRGWTVPINAPCAKCLQEPGDAICRNKCPYYPELIRLRDSGELRKVVKE